MGNHSVSFRQRKIDGYILTNLNRNPLYAKLKMVVKIIFHVTFSVPTGGHQYFPTQYKGHNINIDSSGMDMWL